MRSFKTKVCQICSQEYQPTSGRQKYCAECGPVKKRVYNAKWRIENPEKVRAQFVEWCKENPDKRKASDIKRYKSHPEMRIARNAKWCKDNPEKHSAQTVEWYRKHPATRAVQNSKRRTLKYANTSLAEMLMSTEWLVILAAAAGLCHYCGKEAKLTIDHVIPLSRGGKDSRDNVVAACQHCNSSKGDKTLEEWLGRSR